MRMRSEVEPALTRGKRYAFHVHIGYSKKRAGYFINLKPEGGPMEIM